MNTRRAKLSEAALVMAGKSSLVHFVFKPLNVYSGSTDGWAWRVPQAGKPSAENIRKHVELHNKSLESDGVNSHVGRRGAIYGGSILNQKTGETVAEWEDRGIVKSYKDKPAFEVVGRVAVARELVKIAKLLSAADKDLQAVADVVKAGKFLSLRGALSSLGLGKVDFHMGDIGPAMWVIKTRRGKTIAIVNKNDADAGPDGITVGDFVVDYM